MSGVNLLLNSKHSLECFCRLIRTQFDLLCMLVVNIMHEMELGVWKALFSHLVCILYAAAPSGKLVALLDKRYSQLLLDCGIAIAYNTISQQISPDAPVQSGYYPEIYQQHFRNEEAGCM